jgi:hypothetical protein
MSSALLSIGAYALIAPEAARPRRRPGEFAALALIGALALLGWSTGPFL